MKIGLLLPQGYFNEFHGWTPGDAWARILEVARLAERLGFDSLWNGEHVLAKCDPEAIEFDCVTVMTAVAAVVPNADLGFCVLNSTFRNPAMTAKMAATLDSISGGRLILGLGAGFKESEARAFGYPYPDLGQRMRALAEHFEIISRMTRRDEPALTFAGEHARVDAVTNAPRTGGGSHVRLLIGGHGRKVTFRLAARYCDEININLPVAEMGEAIEVLAERCHENERDPSTLTLATAMNPAWPYPGLRITGRQRMMRQEDIPSVLSVNLATLSSRPEELARWIELGMDRVVCGVPGLVDTDEALHELIEDCGIAGIEIVPGTRHVSPPPR
jgi:alkanesulfonate monooxygenase SsuD/methylene tetrahydromethanopterin reductase-like flavin-dependent oxidoreductase (luciferase family)